MDNENIKNTAEETAEETDIKGGECDGMKNQKKEKKSDKKETEALKAEVEALKKELADAKDSHLRSLAEYDNFRKRSQREKDAVYGDAKANTLALLLPVIDNFDRAAENKTDDPEVYKKGIEMIISQFSDILKRLEVERFGEVGDEFDPNMHNAVMHIDDENFGENIVAEVFQKVFMIGDKVLRFAMVKVAN